MKMLSAALALCALSACLASASAPPGVRQSGQDEAAAQGEPAKVVPEQFRRIDFANYSYPYKFHGRRSISLKNGEYEYDFEDDRGWFNLSDVYYADVTNDGSPEAIVHLTHASCGASCDGGSGLFFIFTARPGGLKPVWQFGTGSLAYRCGLKSFAVSRGRITVELFGRCFDGAEPSQAVGKFWARDTTRLSFVYDGRKVVEVKKEFISAPERNVMNHRPEISIEE